MKNLGFIIISTIFSAQVFAAKFTPITNVDSKAVQKLATVAATIVKKENVFGDASSVKAFSFIRNATELDANTIKQLSFVKGGATSEDTQFDLVDLSAPDTVKYLLLAVEGQENEFEADFKSAKTNLTAVLKMIKADKQLKVFGSGHADEDGSWQIVYILDTVANEILMVTIGFTGT